MPNDIEVFVGCRGLKICRDRLEVGIRRPFRARGKVFATFSKLTLAHIVRGIDEVQLVFCPRLLKQLPEPGPLVPGVAREIEDDRRAPGQK